MDVLLLRIIEFPFMMDLKIILLISIWTFIVDNRDKSLRSLNFLIRL